MWIKCSTKIKSINSNNSTAIITTISKEAAKVTNFAQKHSCKHFFRLIFIFKRLFKEMINWIRGRWGGGSSSLPNEWKHGANSICHLVLNSQGKDVWSGDRNRSNLTFQQFNYIINCVFTFQMAIFISI